jgi:quercetin dioxygenase-like cupin family protein
MSLNGGKMIKKNLYQVDTIDLEKCHEGIGVIKFRKVLEEEFESKISFLHYTTLKPGTTIGYHEHDETEEVYIILKGKGIMNVNGESLDVHEGDVVLTKKGNSHGLANNSNEDLDILVFEGKF